MLPKHHIDIIEICTTYLYYVQLIRQLFVSKLLKLVVQTSAKERFIVVVKERILKTLTTGGGCVIIRMYVGVALKLIYHNNLAYQCLKWHLFAKT